jgi:hypothetical protein
MASLIDIFNKSEYKDQINKKGTDKTPLSIDGGKDIIANDSLVDQTRGGAVSKTPYSDSVTY